MIYRRIRKQQSDIYHIYSYNSTILASSRKFIYFHFPHWKEIPHSELKKIIYCDFCVYREIFAMIW